MNKLILLAIAITFLTSAPIMAGERHFPVYPKSDYRVEIKIVYNEVDAQKAKSIIQEIINRHDKACKVEIETKMVDSNNDVTMTIGGTDYEDYTITNTACTDDDGNVVPCDE